MMKIFYDYSLKPFLEGQEKAKRELKKSEEINLLNDKVL